MNPFLHIIARIRGKLRLRSYHKEQGRKRRVLLPRKDEIIANALSILDAHLRKASIAQVGGFRSPVA